MSRLRSKIIFPDDEVGRRGDHFRGFSVQLLEEFPDEIRQHMHIELEYLNRYSDISFLEKKGAISVLCVFLDLEKLDENSRDYEEQGKFLSEILYRKIPLIAYSSGSGKLEQLKWCPGAAKHLFWLDNKTIFENGKNSGETEKFKIKSIANFILSNHPLYKHHPEFREPFISINGFKPESLSQKNKPKPETTVQVNDEFSMLKKVIIHSPGEEIDLQPNECDKFLFDYPVEPCLFREQQSQFKNKLTKEMNANGGTVIEATDLMKKAFQNEDFLFDCIRDIVALYRMEKTYIYKMFEINKKAPDLFVDMLIDGYMDKDKKNRLLPPVPNFMFTRDWAFTIGRHIFSGKMKEEARMREGLISSYILRHHFPGNYVSHEMVGFAPGDTIEGGDVILLPGNIVLIGISNRTNMEAIGKIARFLGTMSDISDSKKFRVYATKAPFTHPRSMHLDTYLGIFSKDGCVAYHSPLKEINHYYRLGKNGEVEESFYKTLPSMFTDEFKQEMEFTWSFEERDQYNDGCNIFSVRPGTYLTYDMPVSTINQVRKQFGDRVNIITVNGSLLVMARGGAHCMTLPIRREG